MSAVIWLIIDCDRVILKITENIVPKLTRVMWSHVVATVVVVVSAPVGFDRSRGRRCMVDIVIDIVIVDDG